MRKKELDISKEELERLYLTENLSILKIAKKFNTSNSVVTRALTDNNIELRNIGRHKHKELINILTKEYLIQEHTINKKSIEKIAKENNITSSGVKRALDKFNIPHNSYEDYKNSVYFQEDMIKRREASSPNKNLINIFINKEICKTEIEKIKLTHHVTLEYLSNYTGYSYSVVSAYINKYELNNLIEYKYTSSYYEDEIEEFIKFLGITNIERNNRTILDGKEIDIYLPDYKFGIEFNGDYWHNEEKLKEKSGNRSQYHQKKSLLAKSKNVFLFHIFEYEWNNLNQKNKIKQILSFMLNKNITKIYARKCKIKIVPKQDKKDFLNNYHLQGNDTSTTDLGLYYNDELVALMTFRVARFSKKDKYELSRFCSKDGISVIGGASKLFQYYIKNYCQDGDTIVTYNDFTKTKGMLYEKLNFQFDHLANPNYIWINLLTGDIKTRYQCQIKNENKTMISRGYVKICDCGNNVWRYKVKRSKN